MGMETLKPLSDFFSAIEKDCRVGITHIAIYSALLQYRQEQGPANPVTAFSYDIMRIAKVSAAATYYKCIKELDEYGYIKYVPSFKRNRGSRIYFPESG